NRDASPSRNRVFRIRFFFSRSCDSRGVGCMEVPYGRAAGPSRNRRRTTDARGSSNEPGGVMKNWKLHLVWAVITLVAASAWAQRVVRLHDIEFREREKVLQVKLVESKKTAAAFIAVAPVPAPASPIAAF